MSFNLNVPYSAQYATITREGHERSPPSFGAPTLIWHLAISPHWSEEPVGSDGTLGELHTRLATEYEGIRRGFYQGVNRFLVALQEGSAYLPRGVQTFDPEGVPLPWEKTQKVLGEPFSVTEPTTIRFTLWWSDTHVKLAGKPRDDALRIRVHAEAHRDFVTIGIFLDAGKVWNGPAFVRGQQPPGKRRSQIFAEVGRVQGICEQRLLASGRAPVDGPLLPEEISVPDASNLMSASRYLYSTV